MNKEIEALERVKLEFGCDPAYYNLSVEFAIIEQALQRLEAIDNAKPSEALECLEKTQDTIQKYCNEKGLLFTDAYNIGHWLSTIKQNLLKAQELEKVLETLKNKARFYDNNTKCKIEIEADDFNSSKEWEQVKEVLK